MTATTDHVVELVRAYRGAEHLRSEYEAIAARFDPAVVAAGVSRLLASYPGPNAPFPDRLRRACIEERGPVAEPKREKPKAPRFKASRAFDEPDGEPCPPPPDFVERWVRRAG